MSLVRHRAAAFCGVAFLANGSAFLNVFPAHRGQRDRAWSCGTSSAPSIAEAGGLAGSTLAMFPLAALFFFLRKKFIGGLTFGAVKR